MCGAFSVANWSGLAKLCGRRLNCPGSWRLSVIARKKNSSAACPEDRELNKEKFQFQAQLAEYEKYSTLAQLALGAAHGINNPLLGILSHLELELKAASDPDQRWEIEQCIAGTKRISATLRGLVNYARPGPLVLSNLSLHRLVTDTLSFLEGQPALRGKRAENRVPENLPRILVDSNQLSQVLMNLLINAAEATPDGGRITVSASKLASANSIEIRVSDTGCGIPPDILPHVFEPFFTTKSRQGHGPWPQHQRHLRAEKQRRDSNR